MNLYFIEFHCKFKYEAQSDAIQGEGGLKKRLKILNKTTIETAKTLGVVKITKKEGMTWSSQKHQMAESSQMTN